MTSGNPESEAINQNEIEFQKYNGMKKALAITGVTFLILGLTTIGAGLWIYRSVHSVPEFYTEIVEHEPPAEVRVQRAVEVEQKTESLKEELKKQAGWTIEFTQDQVNSWLMERLPVEHLNALPPEIKNPLIKFEPNQFKLGARINTKDFQGVIAITATAEVKESSECILTIESVHAGTLSLPVESTVRKVLEQSKISSEIRVEEIDGRQRFIVPLKLAEGQRSQLSKIEFVEGLARFVGEPVNGVNSEDDAFQDSAD